MMYLAHPINRRGYSFHARLELQRQKLRVKARLGQVAAMKPQTALRCRLPHIAQFAFPGTWILGSARSQSPTLTHFVGHFLRDQAGGPTVHRTIAGGIDYQISRQFAAIRQYDGVWLDLSDGDAAAQPD